MVRSDIDQVGVITKYNYQSLIDHLGSGREWDLARKVGGLHILPPFGNTAQNGIYRGKLEALHGALAFLTHSNCKYVVMSDCNIISNMDYRPLVQYHIEKGADIGRTGGCQHRCGNGPPVPCSRNDDCAENER